MLSIWTGPKFCCVGINNPLPDIPIEGSSNSAANKGISKILINGDELSD